MVSLPKQIGQRMIYCPDEFAKSACDMAQKRESLVPWGLTRHKDIPLIHHPEGFASGLDVLQLDSRQMVQGC